MASAGGQRVTVARHLIPKRTGWEVERVGLNPLSTGRSLVRRLGVKPLHLFRRTQFASERKRVRQDEAARLRDSVDRDVSGFQIRALLQPILAHRLLLTPDAQLRGETIDDVLDRIISRARAPLGVD